MSESLKVAIAGLGTVGSGTVKILEKNKDLILQRAGCLIEVIAVSARDRQRDRGIDLSNKQWFDDPSSMAEECGADIVVELIGGSDGPAKAICEKAIASHKHVVTANKALLAMHGTALAKLAEDANVSLAYEGAVAGGIPIIKALREGLGANNIHKVYGILNGTCNYILSAMEAEGRDFPEVLEEAQRLGYAEADPTFDVEGVDTAHKLSILTSLAFGCPIDFNDVFVEGISHIRALDISFAKELGYRIKLLGITEKLNNGIKQRVHPCLIPESAPIAQVNGVLNAVVPEGDFIGNTVYEGPGAGEGPTASAVVADLIDIARGKVRPALTVHTKHLKPASFIPMSDHMGAYYIRLSVLDKPGVLADVTAVLRDHDVSLESMLQHGRSPGKTVPIVMTTHIAKEDAIRSSLKKISALKSVVEEPLSIRIESLN